MRVSLPMSIALHAAILMWALTAVHRSHDLTPPDEIPVQVDLLTVAELDNMRAGNKDAKVKVAPAQSAKTKTDAKPDVSDKKRVAALPPPPTPDPPKKEEPKKEEVKAEEPKKEEPKKEDPPKKQDPPKQEEPKPEEVKKDDPIAEAIKKAEQDPPKQEPKKEEPKKEEPKKEEPKKEEVKKDDKKKDQPKKVEVAKKDAKKSKLKEKFDPTKVSALLNKLPNASNSAAAKTDATAKQKSEPVVGSSEGKGTQLSASEQSLLRSMFDQQVQRCWTPPIGAREGAVIVTVQFHLNQDGSVEGQPSVVSGGGSVIFDAAARSAVYAVMACAPYHLPGRLYDAWREIEWEFDPSKALNG